MAGAVRPSVDAAEVWSGRAAPVLVRSAADRVATASRSMRAEVSDSSGNSAR
ncbi:Uncharacterised protein [Mycobacteroides abscessus subsp. abscessus]|nr:Uncharacterised protein [Mycobacteroides abscessus subsp. abscessus]